MPQKVPCSPAKYSKIDCQSNLIERSPSSKTLKSTEKLDERKRERRREPFWNQVPCCLWAQPQQGTHSQWTTSALSKWLEQTWQSFLCHPKPKPTARSMLTAGVYPFQLSNSLSLSPSLPSLSLRSVERIILWDSSSSSLSIIHHPVCADLELYKSTMPQPELNIWS